MVKADINCVLCLQSKSTYECDDPTVWAVMTGCGHLFHEGCIKALHKNHKNHKCPTCLYHSQIYDHPSTDSTLATRRKQRHTLQRVYLDIDHASLLSSQADPLHQTRRQANAQASTSHAPITLESESDTDPADGAAEPATVQPGGGIGANLIRARKELRQTQDTLRTVRAERDLLRQLPAQVAALERQLESAEEERDAAREGENHLELELQDLRGYVEELEGDLPLQELKEAREEVAMVTQRRDELRQELAELKKTSVEKENDWGTEAIKWQEERAKYIAQISTTGNTGALTIKKLRKEIDQEQSKTLEAQVRLDRLTVTTEIAAAAAAKSHAAALKAANDQRDAAILNAQQIREREAGILAENARLKSANASYEGKLNRLKARPDQRTPEPEHGNLLSPRRAMVGPYGLPSPRKPSVSPRVQRAPPSSDDDSGPALAVRMNGTAVHSKKRPAPRVNDSDDDFEVGPSAAAARADGEVLTLDSDGEEVPAPLPSTGAFPSLAAPKPARPSWMKAVPKPAARSGQAKYPIDYTASSVRPSGPVIRIKIGRR